MSRPCALCLAVRCPSARALRRRKRAGRVRRRSSPVALALALALLPSFLLSFPPALLRRSVSFAFPSSCAFVKRRKRGGGGGQRRKRRTAAPTARPTCSLWSSLLSSLSLSCASAPGRFLFPWPCAPGSISAVAGERVANGSGRRGRKKQAKRVLNGNRRAG